MHEYRPVVSSEYYTIYEAMMKKLLRLTAVLALLPIFSLLLLARSTHSEKALWITITEHGRLKTTIAVTEPIARLIAKSEKTNVHFTSDDNGCDLITREMIQQVLDGRKSSISARDVKENTEVEIFMKRLKVPGSQKEKSRLVMETFKDGELTFHMKLGEFSFESKDEETGEMDETDFSWKSLLPFLSESGGGVYIQDNKDNTEVWVYVE